MYYDEEENAKIRKSERILVLKPKEGAQVLSSTGLIDNRLFTGGNSLKAVMDPTNCFWELKYEKGGRPEELKRKFTSFPKLLDFARAYFGKRGLDIVEILD